MNDTINGGGTYGKWRGLFKRALGRRFSLRVAVGTTPAPCDSELPESYGRDTIIAKLRRSAGILCKSSLSAEDIARHCRIGPCVIKKEFGTITNALGAAGLTVPRPRRTNQELLEILADLLRRSQAELGRNPKMEDLHRYGIPVRWWVFTKRFGSWKNALAAAGGETDSGETSEADPIQARPPVSDRKRFLVFRRDLYTCRICKATGVKLEVDHIVPHSLGGSDKMDNLQTLCVPCNRGKGQSRQ